MIEALPSLAVSLGAAIPDGFGNFWLMDIPSPSNAGRLGVLYRTDCIEVSFSVAETRGPAEQQILINDDDDVAIAVADTVDFLRDIVADRVVVDVLRCRLLWFRPYYLPFFREALRHPRGCIVRTIRWSEPDDQID